MPELMSVHKCVFYAFFVNAGTNSGEVYRSKTVLAPLNRFESDVEAKCEAHVTLVEVDDYTYFVPSPFESCLLRPLIPTLSVNRSTQSVRWAALLVRRGRSDDQQKHPSCWSNFHTEDMPLDFTITQ